MTAIVNRIDALAETLSRLCVEMPDKLDVPIAATILDTIEDDVAKLVECIREATG